MYVYLCIFSNHQQKKRERVVKQKKEGKGKKKHLHGREERELWGTGQRDRIIPMADDASTTTNQDGWRGAWGDIMMAGGHHGRCSG